MEIIKKFSMLVMMFAISLALLNCTKEGPAGPAGKDGANGANGTNGADGKDGNATCGKCHSDNADAVNLIFAQYEISQHGMGEVYVEEAGRLACGGCHSGDGFAEAAKLGQNDPVKVATSAINCKACHKIHDKYDETDWALRWNQAVTLRKTGAVVDFKQGNTCAKCHQARTHNDVFGADTTFKTTGTTTYTRFGPHYGTAANVVAMKGLYNFDGPETVPTTNIHGNLTKGCVSCHMGALATNPAVGGHSFKMTPAQMTGIEECKTCHPSGDFTAGTKGKEVAAMIAEMRTIIVEKGWMDLSQAPSEYFAQSKEGNYMTKKQVEATLNYFYISRDGSKGAHNPRYVYSIAKNTLEFLKTQ